MQAGNRRLQRRVDRTNFVATPPGILDRLRRGDPLLLAGDQLRHGRIFRRAIEMPLRVEFQLTQPGVGQPPIVPRHGPPCDRQPQRGSSGQISRRFDVKQPGNQAIGHLIVFRSADAVNEQVANQQSGKQRRARAPGCAA